MPKTTLPSIYPPDEARRLKRPGGRYFPAEKLSAATLPARAPSIPKPKVARPLNASLKGFAWRVSEEKIRPSADMADKVYYAPVVPGIPTQRKRPRRPKTLEPLPLGTIAHVRKKVLSALSSALRTEELPEDLSYRVLGTVENALEELDLPGQEVEFSPKPIQTLQFVQRPEVQPPAIEEVREEPEKQEDHAPQTEVEAAASTRPPSSAFLAALEEAPLGDFAECFVEAVTGVAIRGEPAPALPDDEVLEVDGFSDSEDENEVFDDMTEKVLDRVFALAETLETV